jgi:uncharacterized DUF497 family protein
MSQGNAESAADILEVESGSSCRIAHAPRVERTRIISMRKGNRREQEIYQKRLGID